ncbi:hypothetical protein AX14_009343 [Amanita brunnescens Koide BX004]|nr:hypothetical protein AX14_009343 [Amanita brunnescens Koide BX004]
MERAGKMTIGYFATSVIVNHYWNLLPTRTADILEAMNISNAMKTSMHKLHMSVGMQDWLFTIETEQEWLDFGGSSIHARDLFNYHCTDLIELYINIAELPFAEMPTPAGQLDQLGIDLLQHILAANMEEYYNAMLTDVEGDTWGSDLETRDPNVKIVMAS